MLRPPLLRKKNRTPMHFDVDDGVAGSYIVDMTTTKTNRFPSPIHYSTTTAGQLAIEAEKAEKRGATRKARELRLRSMQAFAALMA